jgi:hypothetical protein
MLAAKPVVRHCSSAYVQRNKQVRSLKCFSEASIDKPTDKRKKDIKSTIGNIDSLLGIEEEVKVGRYSPLVLYLENATVSCATKLAECLARLGDGLVISTKTYQCP